MSYRRCLVVAAMVAVIVCVLTVGCGPKPPQPLSQDLPMATPKAAATPTAAPAPPGEVEVEAPKLPSTPPAPPEKTAATTPTAPQPAPAKPNPAPKAAPTKAASAPAKSQPAKPVPAAPAARDQGTVVTGTIETVSKIPDPTTLPYDTCVAFIKYKVNKVVSGAYEGGELLAVFWGLRKGKLQPAASFRVGQSHRLTIEPFSEHEELARVMQADDTNEYSLTPYWVVSYTAE